MSGSSNDGGRRQSSDVLASVGDASPSEALTSRLSSEAEARPAEVEESVVDQTAAADHLEAEEAQAVDDTRAARHLGRKRHRGSKPVTSSGSISKIQVAKSPRIVPSRKPKQKSPARQRQPRAPRAKSNKQSSARARKNRDVTDLPISVKIQRFTKSRCHDEDDPEAEDILNAEIPFANRSGVNAVDVLAQMCEELVNSSLHKLQETFNNAQDAATQKELRVKLRALEAFQEELRTRFLEQTIALDAIYALKKRVREAQKSKLQLRERIVQIRAEREQVALRMDAVRVKHEEEGKEALVYLTFRFRCSLMFLTSSR